MGAGLQRAKAAAKATQEVLKPEPRGHLRDWNFKLETMPARGTFEVLRIYQEVARFDPEGAMVVDPVTGRMFRPIAWRTKTRR